MYIYPIYLAREVENDARQSKGPTIGNVLATRLTWRGMKRKFRKLDWRKEIIDHLIFIDERDMFEAVNIKIEEIINTVQDKGAIPCIEAYVTYSVKDKRTGKIELDCEESICITPILDAKI